MEIGENLKDVLMTIAIVGGVCFFYWLIFTKD